MRCIPFACVSLFLSLFFCNRADARLRETYAESVKRYEKAGFTKERTAFEAPPNDENLGLEYYKFEWSVDRKKLSCAGTELTWTNKDTEGENSFGIIKITQVFYGEWPPTNNPKPFEDVLRCIHIKYVFHPKTKIFEDAGWDTPSPSFPGTPVWLTKEYDAWLSRIVHGVEGNVEYRSGTKWNLLRKRVIKGGKYEPKLEITPKGIQHTNIECDNPGDGVFFMLYIEDDS